MGLKNKSIKFLILVIFLSCIPIQITQSAVKKFIFYSYPTTEPVLDGEPTLQEWSTTHAIIFLMDNIGNPSQTMNVTMMSSYDTTAGTVSFAMIIPDSTVNSDVFLLIFRTNTEDELINIDPALGFGANQDIKGFSPAFNETADGVTSEGTISAVNDMTLGGTNDGQGNYQYSAGKYTIEMTFPLDSGDTIGHDFSLAKNSQIEFTLMYIDDEATTYTVINLTDFDSFILNIGKPKLFGVGTIAMIIGLASSMIVITIIKRKRK